MITTFLPGRTDNDVKNRWHSAMRTKKRALADKTNILPKQLTPEDLKRGQMIKGKRQTMVRRVNSSASRQDRNFHPKTKTGDRKKKLGRKKRENPTVFTPLDSKNSTPVIDSCLKKEYDDLEKFAVVNKDEKLFVGNCRNMISTTPPNKFGNKCTNKLRDCFTPIQICSSGIKQENSVNFDTIGIASSKSSNFYTPSPYNTSVDSIQSEKKMFYKRSSYWHSDEKSYKKIRGTILSESLNAAIVDTSIDRSYSTFEKKMTAASNSEREVTSKLLSSDLLKEKFSQELTPTLSIQDEEPLSTGVSLSKWFVELEKKGCEQLNDSFKITPI